MATSSGSSKSGGRGGQRKRAASRPGSTTKRKPASAKRTSSRRRSASAGRSDKSVQAFRDAVERSVSVLEENVVTVPRDRLQEVVDDAVDRGRMTRADANELVSNLVSRGRKYTDDLIRDLEKLLEQARKEVDARTATARKEVEARTGGARKRATKAADRLGKAARDVADRPLAEADRLRRRAGAGGAPITAYDNLTAPQVKSRLKDLNKADLRKVRTMEKRGKARKSILDTIEKALAR